MLACKHWHAVCKIVMTLQAVQMCNTKLETPILGDQTVILNILFGNIPKFVYAA